MDDPSRPSMTARLWAYADRLMHVHRTAGYVRRRIHYPLYLLRLLIQVTRQWARDRCPQQAAALAFQIALGLVPLMAVGLALLRATGQFGAESALVDFISRQVLPVSREEISQHLLDWSRHVGVGTAGVVGTGTLLVLAFVMATGVERIFNDIWRTDAKRPLWRRLIMFYTLATLVPALIGVSLYHAAHYGLTNGVLGALGAMFATTAGLLLANKWLPRTHVRWIPAIVGALVSAFLFEIAKHLFRVYVAKLAWNKYFGIYGAIGLLPITLLWIYYSWVVTLFGAEVAYAIQHLDHLELLDRRARHIEHEIDRVNPQVAARLLCMVAVERRAGRAPTRGDLARRFDLSVDVAERVLRRLVARRLLGRDEETDPPSYLLARKESEITLWDVWGAFRSADVIAPGVRAMSRAPLDQALTQVDQALSERLRGITLEMLATQAPAAPVLPEEARDETDDEAADA